MEEPDGARKSLEHWGGNVLKSPTIFTFSTKNEQVSEQVSKQVSEQVSQALNSLSVGPASRRVTPIGVSYALHFEIRQVLVGFTNHNKDLLRSDPHHNHNRPCQRSICSDVRSRGRTVEFGPPSISGVLIERFAIFVFPTSGPTLNISWHLAFRRQKLSGQFQNFLSALQVPHTAKLIRHHSNAKSHAFASHHNGHVRDGDGGRLLISTSERQRCGFLKRDTGLQLSTGNLE